MNKIGPDTPEKKILHNFSLPFPSFLIKNPQIELEEEYLGGKRKTQKNKKIKKKIKRKTNKKIKKLRKIKCK
tara:strand:+ start:89 stop:304 length:216 start_codon:yes stop_codon:yes gene_type:complete